MPQCGSASRDQKLRDAPSDEALLAAVRRKDERAFNMLYERYFRRIHNFAFTRMRNRADAEEVVQETFTAVFKSIDAYRGQSSLLAWIYGIAKNTINNQLRHNKLQNERIERAESMLVRSAYSIDAATPEEHLSLRRCSEAVEESLASVSDWQVEVFAMRHLEDLPIQEIADRMSRSNDAIRSSLYRVKRLVVASLQTEQASAV